jgi:hypothetical protein
MAWKQLWIAVLAPACKLIVLVASLVGLALAACLLLVPDGTLARLRRLNRWVSSRQVLKPLEVPRSLEREHVPGRRLWAGLVIAGGAAYVLIVLLWNFDAARLAAGAGARAALAALVIEWLRWVLVAGSLLVLAVGLMMALAPQALEAFEAWSNRWVSTRRALQGGDTMYMPLDSLVERFPRAAGVLLGAFSLAAAGASIVLLVPR